MGIKWTAGTRTFASVAAAGFLAVGLAACGVTVGGSTAPSAKTESAPASHAPAAKSSETKPKARTHDTSAEATAATGKLPDYQPATVISKSSTSTVLKSPDSLTKIGTFFRKALARGGWDVTSSSMSSFHASFTAHRSHEGVSISVYPRSGETGISISRYPV